MTDLASVKPLIRGSLRRARALSVHELVDIGLDPETAYERFTRFEDWPRFIDRLEHVDRCDEEILIWHENLPGLRRLWTAEVIEPITGGRIVWISASRPRTSG